MPSIALKTPGIDHAFASLHRAREGRSGGHAYCAEVRVRKRPLNRNGDLCLGLCGF